MPRDHFGNSRTVLGWNACFPYPRSSSSGCNTGGIPLQIPIFMVSWKGKSARITLQSSMEFRSLGSIPSTLLMTEIVHPSIYPLLNTIYIIIYIPILITIAPLLADNLASVTKSTPVYTTTSTTAPTSCALVLGLIDIGLVTRIR